MLLFFNLCLVRWIYIKYDEIKVGLLYPIISLADNIYNKKIKKKINEKNKFIYIYITLFYVVLALEEYKDQFNNLFVKGITMWSILQVRFESYLSRKF